jgi:hypothetical protein
MLHLGEFLQLGHGNGWQPIDREDWVAAIAQEFREEPYNLVLAGIQAARRRVRYPGEFAKWLEDWIRPDVDKLRLEESRLVRLAEIAGA